MVVLSCWCWCWCWCAVGGRTRRRVLSEGYRGQSADTGGGTVPVPLSANTKHRECKWVPHTRLPVAPGPFTPSPVKWGAGVRACLVAGGSDSINSMCACALTLHRCGVTFQRSKFDLLHVSHTAHRAEQQTVPFCHRPVHCFALSVYRAASINWG